MKKLYKIADIIIEIEYHYSDYLDNNIEAYMLDEEAAPSHKINVILCDYIDKPIGQSNQSKNPYVIMNEDHRIIYALTKKGEVKEYITHDYNFKNIEIKMSVQLIENPAEMEYALLGLIFMDIALRNNYISLHASAIEIENQAVLFSAPSQTGKSTHTKYWKNAFSETRYINDDKPLIKVEEDSVFVYGSPFSGKSKLNQNVKVPLKAIVFIKQGLTNQVKSLDASEKIKELFKNMMRPDDEKLWDQTIEQLNCLIEKIPMYSIDATNDQTAALVVHNIIFNKENVNEN